MESKIIRPGQPRGISGAEAINMILQQLSQFAMEINLINLRLQTIQNLLVAKNTVTVPELETEWNKLMEEAKSLAAKAKLVTPDGQTIVPQGPAGAESTPPHQDPGLTGPEALTPTPSRLPADTEVTMSPEPTGATVAK